MYTDALMEIRRCRQRAIRRRACESQIARLLGDVEPERMIETILEEIGGRRAGNLTDDDVTVLVVRAHERPARYSLRDKFSALMRLSGSLLRSVNPRAERPPLPDANLANLGGAIIPALGRLWRKRPSSD